MLNLLKQDAKVGDTLNLYLTSGDTVKGNIVEIGETYLLMEVDGVKRRYFPQLIGGWDVVNEVPQAESFEVINEQATDVDKKDKEESIEEEYNDVLISLFDKIYKDEHIDFSANIKTNAIVDMILPTGVSVITDSGEQIICHRGFMAGFSRANCFPGKRLYCGNVNNTGTHKGICYISVLQMSFIELRERFVTALSTKPTPSKPIINSIIVCLRNNCNGKSTKKLIADLRNKVNLLVKTGKAEDSELEKYISFKQYEKAFDLIETKIESSEDDKQKSALLLRKAQLYSSLKDYQNAITAYRELISFNEHINSPSKNLSHLYTELSRLLLLIGDKEQAEGARDIALKLNPQNTIAKNIGGLDINKEVASEKAAIINDEKPQKVVNNSLVIKFPDKSLIDDDIDRYIFTDSEIVSLNGEVSNDIANRLIDSACSSDDYVLHLETAKALKSLPIGSYDIQDLEDSITNYSIYKCRSLFNSYKKVVLESDSIQSISVEQLNKIKDCAICYSLETIENIENEDNETATKMLLDCLLLELASMSIAHKRSKESILEMLDFSLDKFVAFCIESKEEDYIVNLIVKLVNYSLQCQNLWEKLVLKSKHFTSLLSYVKENLIIKQAIIKITPPLKSRNANDINFINVLRRHEHNRIKVSFLQLRKIRNMEFDISSINILQKRFSTLMGEKRIRFFNDTDRKSLVDINHLVSLLSLYQNKNKDERKNILSNVLLEIDEILKWNTGATATKIGRFLFYPLLVSWKKTFSNLTTQDIYNDSCLLTLEMDSPYYAINDENNRSFKVVIFNKGNLISEGYKIAIWIDDDKKTGIFKSDDRYILPNSNLLIEIPIPQDKWGNYTVYELNLAISSRYQGKWSATDLSRATITNKRDISFKKTDIKWKDSGTPPSEMFKGRDGIVRELKELYCSQNRRYSYVLYGLSRTGKSSIIDYLKNAIEGAEIEGEASTKIVLPLDIDLGSIHGLVNNSEKFWYLFVKIIYDKTKVFISKYKPEVIKDFKKPDDFSQYISQMEEFHIHPLFMLDEFSYMQNIIDAGYINSAFLQYMRTISADKDLASFIFAGTYDIKNLIHDPKYNISGAFAYLREPDRPLFQISSNAAEELINSMKGKLDFTSAAIREIHRLTGDVPFWIQMLCSNCAIFAVDNNNPVVGIAELEKVVSKMTGESLRTEQNRNIDRMTLGTFSKTQILDTDTEEMKIVLTSIAYIMKDPKMSDGVTYDHIKALWADNDTDILKYDIMDAIDLLCERKTLTYEDVDNLRLYRFSIGLFRRWWFHEHFEFEPQLSKFKKLTR